MRICYSWYDRLLDPETSGHYLCWNSSEQIMWVGNFIRDGDVDTWGDERSLGWSDATLTHWANLPEPPNNDIATVVAEYIKRTRGEKNAAVS